LIRAVNPEAKVSTYESEWQEVQHVMRESDIVIGCVDTFTQRDQLERFCRRFLIPYIDIGMDVHPNSKRFAIAGQVILSFPGDLCMRCLGFLRNELLVIEDQNYGAAGGRPQVVWPNGLLASAAVGIAVSLLCPWEDKPPAIYLDYDGQVPSLTVHNRLLALKNRRCNHFSDPGSVGDAVWVPIL
jgi:hypothetical protein